MKLSIKLPKLPENFSVSLADCLLLLCFVFGMIILTSKLTMTLATFFSLKTAFILIAVPVIELVMQLVIKSLMRTK